MMDEEKKKRFEALGFKVVTSDDEPVTVVFTTMQAVEAVRHSLATDDEQANGDEDDKRPSLVDRRLMVQAKPRWLPPRLRQTRPPALI